MIEQEENEFHSQTSLSVPHAEVDQPPSEGILQYAAIVNDYAQPDFNSSGNVQVTDFEPVCCNPERSNSYKVPHSSGDLGIYWRASVASETLTGVTQLKVGDVCLFICIYVWTYVCHFVL